MAAKNRYLVHAHISEVQFRKVLKLFCTDITASQAATLSGRNRKTVLRLFTAFRRRMVELGIDECPFKGEVEIDESYFGAARVPGKRGRGAFRKTPVFGILERQGRVYTQVVKNCSRTTLEAILLGKVDLSSTIHSDGFRSYDGLVDTGFERHYRIHHGKDEFAKAGVHINGIESFWSFAKRRLAKFNGIPKTRFTLFLKETEFRFNHRNQNLYKLMLASIRNKPINP